MTWLDEVKAREPQAFVLRSNEPAPPRVWLTVEQRDLLVAIAEAAQEWKAADDAEFAMAGRRIDAERQAAYRRIDASVAALRSVLEQQP